MKRKDTYTMADYEAIKDEFERAEWPEKAEILDRKMEMEKALGIDVLADYLPRD